MIFSCACQPDLALQSEDSHVAAKSGEGDFGVGVIGALGLKPETPYEKRPDSCLQRHSELPIHAHTSCMYWRHHLVTFLDMWTNLLVVVKWTRYIRDCNPVNLPWLITLPRSPPNAMHSLDVYSFKVSMCFFSLSGNMAFPCLVCPYPPGVRPLLELLPKFCLSKFKSPTWSLTPWILWILLKMFWSLSGYPPWN